MQQYVVVAEIDTPSALVAELIGGAAELALAPWGARAVPRTPRRLDLVCTVAAPDVERAVDDLNLAVWTHTGQVARAFHSLGIPEQSGGVDGETTAPAVLLVG